MFRPWFYFLLLSLFAQSALSLPPVIKIGGLFDSSPIDAVNEKVFMKAIERVNDEELLGETKLVGLTMRVPELMSFQVERSVCELIKKGCIAIFGPRSAMTTPIVESVCDTKEIPHIQTRWDHATPRGSCSVNLYPDANVLAHALVDVVRSAGWKHFTIVYYDNDGLFRVKKLLEMYNNKGHTIIVRKLSDDGNFRPTLRRIKQQKQTFILIDVPTDILHEVLKQAQQIGLMSSEQNFIINNLDMHTVDLEPFMYSGTNISGIRMVNTTSPNLLKAFDGFEDATPDTIALETVLIYDGVFLLAQSLLNIPMEPEPVNVRERRADEKDEEEAKEDKGGEGEPAPDGEKSDASPAEETSSGDEEPPTCENDIAWPHGYTIINDIKLNTLPRGLSGPIRFDHQGFRTSFQLELTRLTEEGIQGIAKWSPKERIKFYNEGPTGDFSNTTFRIVIALTPPYGMEKESAARLTGNDRYEGYAVDLIHELSLLCKFNYTLEVQADSKGGSWDNKTQRWNGMIGKVLYGEADLAITDLTITRDRESVVDFTMPFMNLGISILYKKPKKMPPSMFSFLSPFSEGVWIYVIAAYIGVSVLFFLMARISPYEWTNPYPCIEEPEELENQFSFSNSFWFTIGSLMQQGSEIAPIAVSTRMMAGIWWFFTLIMVSSYTANLAAFLTVETHQSPFSDVEELEKQTTIKYGAKSDGSTQNFFMTSTNEVYQRMWAYMSTHYAEVMPDSNEAGVNRVNDNDDYAFLMESTSIEYEIERKCNLTQVGGLLDSKGYGIAMRKNQWFRDKLNYYVLTLQERGKLEALKNKWWKEKGAGTCHAEESGDGDTEGLTLANVGGVFVVLVLGIFFSIFVAFIEMFYNLWSTAHKKKVSFKKEFLEEWSFISRCHGSTKRVRRYDQDSASSGGEEECSPAKRGGGKKESAGGKSTASRANLQMIETGDLLALTPRSKTASRNNVHQIGENGASRNNINIAGREPFPEPKRNGLPGMEPRTLSRNNINLGMEPRTLSRNNIHVGMEPKGGSRNDVHMIGFEPIVTEAPSGGREKKKKRRAARNSTETDI
ncbi:hypothetical protein M8J77_023545 [Diaphorina citri]|nr:hypothetical protein M8J77_023545 [Diaphorina citri]